MMDDPLTFYYQNSPTSISDAVLNFVHRKEHDFIDHYNEFSIDIYLLLDNPDSDIIVIDWDNTFTAEVEFFNHLISELREHDFQPIICTYRDHTEESMQEINELLQHDDIPVYHSNGREKLPYLYEQLIDVHLWIDDLYPSICRIGCSLFSENGIDYADDE